MPAQTPSPPKAQASAPEGTAAAAGGVIGLPAEFLRTAVLAAAGIPFIEIVPEGSPIHLQQKHTHTAAAASKPTAVMFADNKIRIYPASLAGAALRYVKKVTALSAAGDAVLGYRNVQKNAVILQHERTIAE